MSYEIDPKIYTIFLVYIRKSSYVYYVIKDKIYE
jgi:hypothetical protein